ncbi:MAG: penicillin-binding transpeptidase domain-containing protein, partial [Planctomycetota bacterium]
TGTANRYVRDQLRTLTFEICGKTGTAQVPPQRIDSNEDGRITSVDQVVRKGNIAWFSGFAPHGKPQIAFAVAVEYVVDGGGPAYAGPIAVEVARLCEQFGYIQSEQKSEQKNEQ